MIVFSFRFPKCRYDISSIILSYTNTVIYLNNKKSPNNVEYFIWTIDSIIARTRLTNHYFIDATFHHPIFKDMVIYEYLPCFYILVNNKSEIF